jgi:hypothetical protein
VARDGAANEGEDLMRRGLVTTSINIPYALEPIAKWDDELQIFIAADEKTPPEAEEWVYEHCQSVSRISFLTVERQQDLGYKCSELLGWNNDSRRDIAVLEAMRDRCEYIISWDDDMHVLDAQFGWEFEDRFNKSWTGLKLGAAGYWFDHGQFTVPPARARGIPYDIQYRGKLPSSVTDVEIGVVQGIILGVPDADACTAIACSPLITDANAILRNGFVLDLNANAVFNSQLTAFRARFAPAFAQFYFAQGRNTDIFASLLMRRVMREQNMYTNYGPPMVFHARQPRPLLKDLQAERYGVDNIAAYADYLNRAPLPKDATVTEQCRILAQGWNGPEMEAAMAWYQDCESVLK